MTQTATTVHWPRPFTSYKEAKLPIPWISQSSITENEAWAEFDESKTRFSVEKGLCSVCGEVMTGAKIHLAASFTRDKEPIGGGPPNHPKCALLAFTFCPLFAAWQEERDFVFYQWEGEGVGLTEEGLAALHEGGDMVLHPDSKPLTWQQVKDLALAEKEFTSHKSLVPLESGI